ncbi:Envelope glycoprotein B [Gossypium arboreum]|uniref:Envelope glycoprotein B n=1 Tax=Gossypium arboreum TaxID=29729 RepID=A0A0B0PBJ6_GOSAR|nr:Envelope glycoprotein B [Gossypium arboreum]
MLQYDFSCFKLAFNTESLLTKMRTSHSQKTYATQTVIIKYGYADDKGEITSLKGFEAIDKQPEPSLFALEPASAYHSTYHSTL